MKKKILIIVSHPDDEILGCGGTMSKFVKLKCELFVYFTHEGSSSRYDDSNNKNAILDIQKRKSMALKAANYLKYKITYFGKEKNLDNQSFNILQNTKKIIKIINKIKPDIIFTHNDTDLNYDHHATYRSVINACRPNIFFVKEIYLIEIPSSTDWNINNDFKPNKFINIEKHMKNKIKLLNFYKTELKKAPHSRSLSNIKALAKYRGGQVGLSYAEAFKIYRSIDL
jgi:LmbE family N-acetylglucosaminyl deacetylase